MRKLMLAAAMAGILGLLASPALAGGSVPTGTIELAADTAARSDGSSGPAYGSSAGFVTSVEGRIGPKARVYVTVVCMQGGAVVYQWSADPGFTFPLVDQPGQGLEWDGGEADCTGTLIYRDDSGRSATIVWLDQTTFHVGAA